MLVLLMTAVTGAVAQSYEAKVFDVPASWDSDYTFISAADLPEDFVQITEVEARALAVPDGTVVLIYGFEGDNVKVMEFNSGTYSSEDEGQIVRGNFIWLQTEYNAIICYPAAASAEAPAVTPTENKNEWTFTMPDYAVVVNVEYDTELALNEVDDNTAALAEWDDYEADVTLTRTLQTDNWNTFCVPFDMTIPSGWTVMELSSSELSGNTLTLNFAEAASIVAGTPYLVKVESTVENPNFIGVTVSNAVVPTENNYVDFIPTLGATTITGDDAESVLFLAAGNKLKNPASLPSNIKGFRAYFQLKNASAARAFSLNFGDETTGANDVRSKTADVRGEYHDLQGRRVSSAGQKGVYIVNGKKVVVK